MKKKTKDQVLEWVAEQEQSVVWPKKILKSGPNKGKERLLEQCFDMADAYVIGKSHFLLKK